MLVEPESDNSDSGSDGESEVGSELEPDDDDDESLISFLAQKEIPFLSVPCLVAWPCAAPLTSSEGLCLFLGMSSVTSTFRFAGCMRRRKLRPV